MSKNNFRPIKTNCSFDMPQELFSCSDFLELEIKFKGKSEVEFVNLYEIDWSEVIGWRYSK
jgi:hypothetical protein